MSSSGITLLPKISGSVEVTNTITTDFVGPAEVYKSGLKVPTVGTTEVMIDLQPGINIRLRRIDFVSRSYGRFSATINNVEFAAGNTSPEMHTIQLVLVNWQDVGPTDDLKLVFDQPNGPETDADARIYYTV